MSWDRLLFSTKESVYKAWFPLAERWLGFEDARVTIDRDRGSFAARLLVPGPRLDGRELSGFSRPLARSRRARSWRRSRVAAGTGAEPGRELAQAAAVGED